MSAEGNLLVFFGVVSRSNPTHKRMVLWVVYSPRAVTKNYNTIPVIGFIQNKVKSEGKRLNNQLSGNVRSWSDELSADCDFLIVRVESEALMLNQLLPSVVSVGGGHRWARVGSDRDIIIRDGVDIDFRDRTGHGSVVWSVCESELFHLRELKRGLCEPPIPVLPRVKMSGRGSSILPHS